MINQILEKYIPNLPSIIKIDEDLKDNIKDIVNTVDIGKSFVIVSDNNTYDILGEKVKKSLSEFKINSIILKTDIADDSSVNKVRSASENYDAVIAIGSGTINDICKYASYLENKPYIVFGTAPSMNGYSSANASITIEGHKKTLKAQLPKGIFLDLGILSSAPKRLIQSGLGDSLCRPTAQADWLLSNLLLDTEYDSTPFEMLAPLEKDLFENSSDLLKGDKENISLLAQTLILSGFGMYLCHGSYPASQGEHMIAHTMEMAFKNLPKSYHGEQIGVTTLFMADIIQTSLQTPPLLKQDVHKQIIYEFFGNNVGEQCMNEYSKKLFSPENLDNINHKILSSWDDICQKISKISIPRNKLENTLASASCPTSPKDIGWNESDFLNAIKLAKYTRNRFTFLDLQST